MRDRITFGWLACLALAATLRAGEPPVGVTTPDPEALRTIEGHLGFLASDAMGGRETGTLHGDITAAYIASVFGRLGLLPAGDGDDFRQAYPLTETSVDLEATRLTVSGVEASFAPVEDWSVRGLGQGLDLTAGVVFAGHAVVDEQAGLDELAGVDLTGKLVLARTGVPEGFEGLEDRFDGSAVAWG